MTTIDISEWNVTLECGVFHYSDCLSNPAPILKLIEIANDTFRHLPLNSELVANRIGPFRLRKLKPNPRNWSKVQSEIQEGQISTLVFGSIRPEDQLLTIAFHMGNEIDRKQPSSRDWFHDSVGLLVADALLKSGTVDLEMCRNLIHQAWVELSGVYAFADMFVSHRTGRVSPWKRPLAARVARAKPGSYEVGQPTIDLRTHVPDAYWLNFLNATHLKTLGGVDSLKTRLPNADIRPLPYNGASIQISPSPIYESLEQWEADHESLKTVLAPIIVER